MSETDADERHARFSGDGRWIAYASNETGRFEVFVQPFPPTGARWQASVGGGDQPVWRRDGRELYYLDPGGALTAIDVDLTSSGFTGKNVRKLLNVDPAPPGSTRYDVNRAGTRFLVAVAAPATPTPPATVIVNGGPRTRRDEPVTGRSAPSGSLPPGS